MILSTLSSTIRGIVANAAPPPEIMRIKGCGVGGLSPQPWGGKGKTARKDINSRTKDNNRLVKTFQFSSIDSNVNNTPFS